MRQNNDYAIQNDTHNAITVQLCEKWSIPQHSMNGSAIGYIMQSLYAYYIKDIPNGAISLIVNSRVVPLFAIILLFSLR